MAVHVRKRGKVYYARGTVRVGQEVRQVKDHPTGFNRKLDAEDYASRLEDQIRRELLNDDEDNKKKYTFADAALIYIQRPEGLHPNDEHRIQELNEILGDKTIADIKSGWTKFKKERCADIAPATVNRFRDTLQAAINYAGEDLGYDPVRIPRIKIKEERVRWLTKEHAEILNDAYHDRAHPIVLMLRYNGPRTQEALQLQFPHLDFRRETIQFDRTKNGEPRTISMHPRVNEALERIWIERGRPNSGHVFLNQRGQPYADTRDYKHPGGQPLRSAHGTALDKVIDEITIMGGQGFRVHDWRHHWASQAVMDGVDLLTLQKLGGWKSLRMVQRYAAFSTEHMRDAIHKIK